MWQLKFFFIFQLICFVISIESDTQSVILNCGNDPKLCGPPTSHPSPVEAHPYFRKPTTRPTEFISKEMHEQQEVIERYTKDASKGVELGLFLFLISMIGAITMLIIRAANVLKTARQLREYILVQHYTTHNSLDESSPNSKTQYTVRDITYSILESTREASSHDSLSSSHNSSIHEIALEKSSHDWNTEDTIRAIKKGEYELPLKKFQETSYSLNPKPPLPPSHHAKKPTYSSSRSPNPSPVSFRTPNPSSRSPNPSPVSSRSPNSRNHDEEDDISVITSTEDEISSTTGASVNTIHSLKSDHRQQINTQNVIGISPIDSHERMASSRHGYNPSRPTNNIVVTLPDFDRRKESFPSQI